MDRLLIAVQSDMFAQYLAKAFQSEYQIRTCCDGCEALELLASFRPQAMILSLRLPRKDSITILTQSYHIPPIILGIAEYYDPYCFSAAQRLGVEQILVTPMVNTVTVTLCQMRLQLANKAAPDPEGQVTLLLHSLGFQPNLVGFGMLCAAIPLCAEDPQRKLGFEVYPVVAARFGCDCKSVEASIRRSIKKAWLMRDDVVWSKFFSVDSTGHIPCPNNALFLKKLAQQIQL